MPAGRRTTLPSRLAILAALLLAGCATADRLGAARDVRALMIAVRDDDQASFDAHVDRPALRARMQAMLVQRTRAAALPPALTAAGVLASGALSRWAAEAVIRPDVFRAIADYYGYRPRTPLPSVLALTTILRPLPGGGMCAARDQAAGDCLLTFAREDGTWKLADFAPSALRARVSRP